MVRAATIALALGVLQLVVAGAMMLVHLPPVLRSLHEATGVGIWIGAFALAYLARIASGSADGHARRGVDAVAARRRLARARRAQHRRGRRARSDRDASRRDHARAQSFARDLVALTKPRIISLLLVTTIAPMYVAGRPSWQLVLAVFVGGYLMAGGANAVNMYMDRDIDDRMSRTRLRPIPSGRMRADAVLAFGVLLRDDGDVPARARRQRAHGGARARRASTSTSSSTRAGSSAATPQNIVIGGAAGAFPPLVGWAAVTDRVDLLAVYLFLIIFYWTPPHFWALALLKQRDYGRAGVPMAPLVWGERETKRQMLWYTLILIPLTLLPVRVRRARPRRTSCRAALLGGWLLVGVRARDARRGLRRSRRGGVQVLAALPRAALRGDGRRPGARVTGGRATRG